MPRPRHPRPTAATPPPALAEPLEPRVLLSGAFASVGLGYRDSGLYTEAEVYTSEGTLADNGSVTGTWFVARPGGRSTVGALPYSSVTELDDGRLLRAENRGFNGKPGEQNAAQYQLANGFGAGWWFAQYFRGEISEVEFIVERADSLSLSDLQGTWNYSLLGLDLADSPDRDHTWFGFDDLPENQQRGDGFGAWGQLAVNGSELRYFRERGFLPRSLSIINPITNPARATTSNGEYIYLSRDRSVMIFADMSRGDEIYIGIATRATAGLEFKDLVGAYLVTNVSTDYSAESAGYEDLAPRQWWLDLEIDGEYKLYDLDDYDSGIRDAISKGFWRVEGDRLVLDEDRTTNEFIFVVSANGSNLIAAEERLDGVRSVVSGLATRAFPAPGGLPSEVIFTTGSDQQLGRPVVYELDNDGGWTGIDLTRIAGGPTVTGNVVTWHDPKDNRHYAAGLSSQGLILYTGRSKHLWTFRNLGTEITSSLVIDRSLSVMISPDGTVTLAGLTAQGKVVRYHQNGQRNPDGSWRWSFVNISDNDLVPQGMDTPSFAGPLVCYATSWGGQNIAGLDADGNIWSVWWSPGLSRWRTDNLTASFGSLALRGGLTVYLTSWSGINIAGIDTDGHLRVTWWVPSFGGDWKQNNLTSDLGGPQFVADTVSSYVSTWDGLNIVGKDATTGATRVYWWSPTRVNDGWAVTTLDDAIGPGVRISTHHRGHAGRDGSLNVFGCETDGQLIRYYWTSTGPDRWQAQNISQIAQFP